jgi:hypothetical protein
MAMQYLVPRPPIKSYSYTYAGGCTTTCRSCAEVLGHNRDREAAGESRTFPSKAAGEGQAIEAICRGRVSLVHTHLTSNCDVIGWHTGFSLKLMRLRRNILQSRSRYCSISM